MVLAYMAITHPRRSRSSYFCSTLSLLLFQVYSTYFYRFSNYPYSWFVMAALRSRCGHYILVLFLLFSSPNLSRRRLDVYHTSTHGVALVRI